MKSNQQPGRYVLWNGLTIVDTYATMADLDVTRRSCGLPGLKATFHSEAELAVAEALLRTAPAELAERVLRNLRDGA